MTEMGSRRGAVDPGTILMVLAFLVIGGFLFWLNGQAAEERALTAVVEDTTTVEVDTNAGMAELAAAEVETNGAQYEGREVRVEPLNVAGMFGQQGFFLDLPSGPFLVAMSDELRAEGLSIAPGNTVRVTGTLYAMTDSIANAWLEAGNITAAEQPIAAFSVHFIEATQVDVSNAQPAGGDDADGADGGA